MCLKYAYHIINIIKKDMLICHTHTHTHTCLGHLIILTQHKQTQKNQRKQRKYQKRKNETKSEQ